LELKEFQGSKDPKGFQEPVVNPELWAFLEPRVSWEPKGTVVAMARQDYKDSQGRKVELVFWAFPDL
jgi:hypothetical protein